MTQDSTWPDRNALQSNIKPSAPVVHPNTNSAVSVCVGLSPLPSERWCKDFAAASDGRYSVFTHLIFFDVGAKETPAIADGRLREVHALIAATNAEHARLVALKDRAQAVRDVSQASLEILAREIEAHLRTRKLPSGE